MKKFAVIILGILIFTGCDLFAIPPDVSEVEVVEDPVVDEVVIEGDEVPKLEVELPADASPEVLLASCLTENGVKLYTAAWCGHCQTQKATFKDGLEYLDHTECADGDDWAEACTAAGVEAVPTWILPDGTKKTGNTPLETLAELGGCEYLTEE